MNYEPNTREWQVDDLVVHDCDAKTPQYLMRVLAVHPMNLIETTYTNRDGDLKDPYINHLSVLHDPKAFGMGVESGTTENGVKKRFYELWRDENPTTAIELQTERRLAYDFAKTDEFKAILKRAATNRRNSNRQTTSRGRTKR